jgi:hypothetical protein
MWTLSLQARLDNTILFYIALMLMMMMIGEYAASLHHSDIVNIALGASKLENDCKKIARA